MSRMTLTLILRNVFDVITALYFCKHVLLGVGVKEK
jgi:hypothetical protein